LSAIRHNYRAMRARLAPGTKFLGVVKADAYGHGAVPVARLLEQEGADYLAVACLDEAIALREAGLKLPILILGITAPEDTAVLMRYDITSALGNRENAEAMSRLAVEAGGKVKVHLKVDSGMGRVGFTCHGGRDPLKDMLAVMGLPGLDIEGIFTHFATSDMPGVGDDYQQMQFSAFRSIIERLEQESGKKFAIRHCTNSGAMTGHPDTYMDMVRPGIALYGCYPCELTGGIELRPAMSVRSRIVQIKEFGEGDTVSYGRTWTSPGVRKIAIVPIGYADGLHRVLSNKIQMLVRGQRVSQVGRICMDMCMLDVTDAAGASVGDTVTLFGRDGEAFIPVEEQAEKAGTISYELLCDMSPRVQRVYLTD